MRGARIYYPRVPRLMRDDHRRISSRCVTNRNSSCTTSLDHTLYKTLPASGLGRPTRYKTLPASGLGRPTRYKTLPAARLGGPPGTKLSQRARLGGPPGTKLSQQAALAGPPGTKLSQRAPKRRFRPTFRMQGELCTASATNTTSRANNFAHQHPTAPQQRAPLQISHAIRLNRTFNKAQKRCNSNDMNSNFEIAKRELHAKLAKQDWRAAGPGRAPRRRTEPHISDTAPPVWRAPECPKGLATEPTSSDRGKPGKTRT